MKHIDEVTALRERLADAQAQIQEARVLLQCIPSKPGCKEPSPFLVRVQAFVTRHAPPKESL